MIPKEVTAIIEKLNGAGYEAYIVGGCVRDLLLKKEPQDWDVATNAKPQEIQKIFPDNFYENNFLTVTVRTGSEKLPEIEVTTYRLEAEYSDKRHPDKIQFAKTLDEDLARRDFTINALAMDERMNITDLFDGQKDLKNKIIRAVGNANERFNEDALRMIRAVRLATVLGSPTGGFTIEEKTSAAIKKNAVLLERISSERIRDELVKIIMADKAADGIHLLHELGLLKFIMPELEENVGVGQNKHHIYDCYWHALKALEYSAKQGFSLQVRLASLLHDIAKPRVKAGEGPNSTFYNHEVVGAKMAQEILARLKFSKKDIEKITILVRYHLFYYNVGEVTESSVRRLIKNAGADNMENLLRVRQADRIGSGVPKAEPYKLRHLKYIIDKVSHDPISVKMLKVGGNDIMKELGIAPGPKVGLLLNSLLAIVLEDPSKNTKEFLLKKARELNEKSPEELAQSLKKIEQAQEKEEKERMKKYYV